MDHELRNQINWYAKLQQDDKFYNVDEIYAGSYHQGDMLKVALKIWNNQYGDVNMPDIKSFGIKIFFETEEDNHLLKYCSAIINGQGELPFKDIGSCAVLYLPDSVILSGRANNGDENDYPDNVLDIDFVFKAPKNIKLKMNDLKNVYFQLIKK